jgi:hypothetical protein
LEQQQLAQAASDRPAAAAASKDSSQPKDNQSAAAGSGKPSGGIKKPAEGAEEKEEEEELAPGVLGPEERLLDTLIGLSPLTTTTTGGGGGGGGSGGGSDNGGGGWPLSSSSSSPAKQLATGMSRQGGRRPSVRLASRLRRGLLSSAVYSHAANNNNNNNNGGGGGGQQHGNHSGGGGCGGGGGDNSGGGGLGSSVHGFSSPSSPTSAGGLFGSFLEEGPLRAPLSRFLALSDGEFKVLERVFEQGRERCEGDAASLRKRIEDLEEALEVRIFGKSSAVLAVTEGGLFVCCGLKKKVKEARSIFKKRRFKSTSCLFCLLTPPPA